MPRQGRGHGPHGCPQWHAAPPRGVSQLRPTGSGREGQGRAWPTRSSPHHDLALLWDGKASLAVGGGRLSRELPIPGRTLVLLAKVQRELGSASVSPARKWWHPELGGPGHPNQSRTAAACAGLVVAEEAPGLGQQPGVVAPGRGWHRSRAPTGAGEEQEGRLRIQGGCWLCCHSKPCQERALHPGVRSPTVSQGYCDPCSVPKPAQSPSKAPALRDLGDLPALGASRERAAVPGAPRGTST